MPAKRIPALDVWEGTRRVVSMTVKDTDGVAIPLASMTTIKLTLQTMDGDVVNSRDAQNVKNANGGTYADTSGLLSIILTPADNAIVGEADLERHSALIEFAYASGTKADSFPFYIDVTRTSR